MGYAPVGYLAGTTGNAQTAVAPTTVTSDPTPTAAELDTPYGLDTSGGAFSFTAPASPPAGTIADLSDPVKGGSWQTHAPTFKAAGPTGVQVQDATNPELYHAGATGTVLSSGAANIRFRYWPTQNYWKWQ